MRIIKKYANRKLYDVKNARYINLPSVISLLKNGEDIKFINKNKDDITKDILLKCCNFLAEKSNDEILRFIKGQ